MMSDLVTEVTVMCPSGQLKKYSTETSEFGYRHSIFQNRKEIVLNAELMLNKNRKETIKERMLEYRDWRRTKQPLDLPNAGSIFKNPKHSSAGKLIDEVGLKGLRIGNAKISEEHANFIVNLGNAAASDVLKLIDIVETTVFQEYGIRLVPEIRIIGRVDIHNKHQIDNAKTLKEV